MSVGRNILVFGLGVLVGAGGAFGTVFIAVSREPLPVVQAEKFSGENRTIYMSLPIASICGSVDYSRSGGQDEWHADVTREDRVHDFDARADAEAYVEAFCDPVVVHEK
jgi:hypothetical protein